MDSPGALHVPLELRKDSSSPTQEWVVCSQITSIRSTRGACPVLSKRLPCSLQSASHVLLSGALARSGRWGEERLTQSSHLRGSVRMPQIPAQSRTAGNPFSWGLTYKYSWSWGYCLIMIIFLGGVRWWAGRTFCILTRWQNWAMPSVSGRQFSLWIRVSYLFRTYLNPYFITSKMYCNPDSWLCFYLNQSTNVAHKH